MYLCFSTIISPSLYPCHRSLLSCLDIPAVKRMGVFPIKSQRSKSRRSKGTVLFNFGKKLSVFWRRRFLFILWKSLKTSWLKPHLLFCWWRLKQNYFAKLCKYFTGFYEFHNVFFNFSWFSSCWIDRLLGPPPLPWRVQDSSTPQSGRRNAISKNSGTPCIFQ